jgi:hypothetical protein
VTGLRLSDETVRVALKAGGVVLSRPQHTVTSPDPEYQVKKPIEMLWRHFRREVTHCEPFASVKALLAAAADFFARYNREPQHTLSVIGAKLAIVA